MSNYLQETIVLEGLSGVGKTTAAQNLATYHGYSNFNTGSLFRATAAAMLLEAVDIPDLEDYIKEARYDIDLGDPVQPYIAVTGSDVSDMLQTPKVARLASYIGSQQGAANMLERTFDSSLPGARIVVEGKHIGDRVQTAPNHRFFLVATQQVRAERKHRQAQLQGNQAYSLQLATQDILIHDSRDRHLLKVEGEAHIIDTSLLTPGQVVGAIIQHRDQAISMV